MTTLVKRIFSYGELNEIYREHFDPIPFTDFEMQLFNGDIHDIDIKHYVNDIEKICSLSNYYTIKLDNKNYLKCINVLLQNGDTRGFNKLGVYLLTNNKQEEALKVLSVGATKGNFHCMANLGSIYAQKQIYDTALNYYLSAIKGNIPNMCHMIAMMYFAKNDESTAIKFLTQGLFQGEINCMEILEDMLDRNDLYWFLSKLKFQNELVINKIIELNKTMTVNEIEENVNKKICILTENGQLLNSNFDQIFDLNSIPNVDITSIHTINDVFEVISTEILNEKIKEHDSK